MELRGGDASLAGQIVVTHPSLGAVLEGPVESACAPDLVIGGITIRIGGGTTLVDPDGCCVKTSDFFKADLIGTRVRVDGTWGDGRILAADRVAELR